MFTEQQMIFVADQVDQLAGDLDILAATANLTKSLRDQFRDKRGGLSGTALELVAASGLYCAATVTEISLDPTDFVPAGAMVVTRKALLRQQSKDIANTVGLDPSAFMAANSIGNDTVTLSTSLT